MDSLHKTEVSFFTNDGCVILWLSNWFPDNPAITFVGYKYKHSHLCYSYLINQSNWIWGPENNFLTAQCTGS